MREFRKKQRILKKILNVVCVFTAAFMFAYIFAAPFIKESLGMGAITAFSRASEILVLLSVAILLVYNIKFSKTNSLLEWIEYELDDAGYYYLNREETDSKDFIDNCQRTLITDSFITENDVDAHDFEISLKATKGKTIIYFANVDDLDRNDIIAYIDSVTYDATVKNLKRRADILIMFVTNKAKDDACALAKMVTTIGRKDQIKIAMAIAELDTKKCYFLGNRQTVFQKLVAKYIMNTTLPFDNKFVSTERLASQDELEESMKSFNAKDFVNGKFFIR